MKLWFHALGLAKQGVTKMGRVVKEFKGGRGVSVEPALMWGEPTGASCSNIWGGRPARAAHVPGFAGFPIFLFLLTLRNFTASKLPVLSSHAPHLIIDTCLSRKREEKKPHTDRLRERERGKFSRHLSTFCLLSYPESHKLYHRSTESFYSIDSKTFQVGKS